jgi:hypothetical protein
VVVAGGVALAIGLRQIPQSERGGEQHAAHYIADDLRDLSADQLRNVLASFDQMVTGTVPADSTDLRELDSQQLKQMLRSLEG